MDWRLRIYSVIQFWTNSDFEHKTAKNAINEFKKICCFVTKRILLTVYQSIYDFQFDFSAEWNREEKSQSNLYLFLNKHFKPQIYWQSHQNHSAAQQRDYCKRIQVNRMERREKIKITQSKSILISIIGNRIS